MATHDVEGIHQKIYRHMHKALLGILPEEKLTGELWLATEAAAKDVANCDLVSNRDHVVAALQWVRDNKGAHPENIFQVVNAALSAARGAA